MIKEKYMVEYDRSYGANFSTKTMSKGVEIDDDLKQLTFIIYDTDVLNEISELCLPKAGNFEFQVHYEGFHIEIKKNNKIVNFMIPLAYYNFEQEVSSASVDYELKDVTEAFNSISKKVDVSVFDSLIEKLNQLVMLGFEINYYRGDFGSIHRHPSMIKFSMTDLRNDPENPGIIFRKATFKGLQTDSIIYIPNGADSTNLFHSEARRIDIEYKEDEGITGTYQQNKCVNVFYRKNGYFNETITFEDILNLDSTISDIRNEFKFYVDNEEYSNENKLLETIIQEYDESNFKPDISAINPENIKERSFSFNSINGFSYTDLYKNKSDDSFYKDYWKDSKSFYEDEEVDTGIIHVYDKKDRHIETIEDDIKNIGSESFPVIKWKGNYFSTSNEFKIRIDKKTYIFDYEEYEASVKELKNKKLSNKKDDDLFDYSQFDM